MEFGFSFIIETLNQYKSMRFHILGVPVELRICWFTSLKFRHRKILEVLQLLKSKVDCHTKQSDSSYICGMIQSHKLLAHIDVCMHICMHVRSSASPASCVTPKLIGCWPIHPHVTCVGPSISHCERL